jgi:hypothetical protein
MKDCPYLRSLPSRIIIIIFLLTDVLQRELLRKGLLGMTKYSQPLHLHKSTHIRTPARHSTLHLFFYCTVLPNSVLSYEL